MEEDVLHNNKKKLIFCTLEQTRSVRCRVPGVTRPVQCVDRVIKVEEAPDVKVNSEGRYTSSQHAASQRGWSVKRLSRYTTGNLA